MKEMDFLAGYETQLTHLPDATTRQLTDDDGSVPTQVPRQVRSNVQVVDIGDGETTPAAHFNKARQLLSLMPAECRDRITVRGKGEATTDDPTVPPGWQGPVGVDGVLAKLEFVVSGQQLTMKR